MFLVPTGVGKTDSTKSLSAFLFQTPQALMRIDMMDYMELDSFNVSRPIGAPAGYAGYAVGGQLIEAVRRRAKQIILFDELYFYFIFSLFKIVVSTIFR